MIKHPNKRKKTLEYRPTIFSLYTEFPKHRVTKLILVQYMECDDIMNRFNQTKKKLLRSVHCASGTFNKKGLLQIIPPNL